MKNITKPNKNTIRGKDNQNKPSKRPYIAYYRVSTDKQGIKGLGIEAQQTSVKKYIESQKGKYPPDHEFREVESGKSSKRPELAKALELCKKKKGILIVAKLDRLSRDLHFITSLRDKKIDFVCCDMPEANKFTINIIASLAEWEREKISERTREALAEIKRKGEKKLGYHRPEVKAGLMKYWKKHKKPKTEKKAKKQKEVKPFIKRADAFAEGLRPTLIQFKKRKLTLKEMANELMTMNIPTRENKTTWRITQIARLQKRLGITQK